MKTLILKITMIALGVADPARSIKFYGETLGLEMIGKPGEVTMFKAGDVTLVLNQPLGQSQGPKMYGAVEVIFPVESVTAAHVELAGRGCEFIQPPHEVTTGLWAATLTDPDGHKLTILGPK